MTVRPPVHSQQSELFSLCGSLHSDQSVLELDHRRPFYGQLTRTAVRISADQYHMTLSWSHVSTNRDQVFYYGFSLTIYKLLIDCKLKFHFASSSSIFFSSNCSLYVEPLPQKSPGPPLS